MTHVEFWCKRCYIPKGHFTHQESITDAPMLRVCGKPPAPGRGRRRSGKPGSPWERADTPDTRTAETPPACSQRLTRGVAPHAQTPKSRRSDSQDCFKRTRAFSDSCSARAWRDAGVDLPRTNFGGPCPEPQRPGGSLDPESRGPLGCREGHFRYRHVPHSPRGEALGEAKLYMLL